MCIWQLCGHSTPVSDSPPTPGLLITASQPISIAGGQDNNNGGQAETLKAQPVRADCENGLGSKGNSMSTTPKIGGSRDEIHSPQHPRTLQQEFTLLNIDIPYVRLQEVQ